MHRAAERPIASRSARATSAAPTQDADEKLGITRELMGGDPTTFAGSDHGFAPAVVRRQRQLRAEPGARSAASRSTRAAAAPRTAAPSAAHRSHRRRRPVATDDIAKACWAGGTIQIYINPNRLKNAAQPTSATFPTYEEVRTAIRDAFAGLDRPGEPRQAGRPARS